MKFKIILPTGYQIESINNDNLDINVILENEEIFFATIFTIDNIQSLMQKDSSIFFWADNMVVLKDLKKNTIKNFIIQALDDEIFTSIFYKIGNLKDTKGYPLLFDNIVDFSTGREI